VCCWTACSLFVHTHTILCPHVTSGSPPSKPPSLIADAAGASPPAPAPASSPPASTPPAASISPPAHPSVPRSSFAVLLDPIQLLRAADASIDAALAAAAPEEDGKGAEAGEGGTVGDEPPIESLLLQTNAEVEAAAGEAAATTAVTCDRGGEQGGEATQSGGGRLFVRWNCLLDNL